MWECKVVQPLWKTGWQFLKKLNINISHTHIPYDLAFLLRCLLIRRGNTCPHKNMYMNVYSGISPTRQKQKQSKYTLTGEWINQMFICAVGYYLAIKKEQNACYNVGEPQKHYAK